MARDGAKKNGLFADARWSVVALVAAVAFPPLGLRACAGNLPEGAMRGKVAADGSSTVFPITEAVAEAFGDTQPRVMVPVGQSGTGGGFKKFCVSEIDINNASRTIDPREHQKAAEHGVAYIELPVAYDGLTVVVSRRNNFVKSLTTAELKRIWAPGSEIRRWRDLGPEFPDEPIALYGPGADSGTFDYFTEAINGKAKACRRDFTASEDDNILVQAIGGDHRALGFLGFAYYRLNETLLRAVAIDAGGGAGPVEPTEATIESGAYAPLSRPLFIYVNAASARREEVRAFVRFYLSEGAKYAAEVGYVPLPARVYALARARFDGGVTGTRYADPASHGKSLDILYGSPGE